MLKNYEKYLEEISNKLLRNNINLGKQPDSNYEDIFYFSEQLSDVLWYMYIMKVVMAQEGEGYIYQDVYTLKSLVKEKANKEFLEEGRDLRKIQVPLMGIIGNSKLSSEPEEDDNDAWVNDSDEFIDDAVDFDEEVVDEDEEDDLDSSEWVDSDWGGEESPEEKEETFVDDIDWDDDFSSDDDPDKDESDESEDEFYDDADNGFVDDEEDFDDEEESDSEEEFYDDADWGDSDEVDSEDSEDEFFDDADDGFVDDEEDFDDESESTEDGFVDDVDWDDDFDSDDDEDEEEEEEFVYDVDWGDSDDDDEEEESEEELSSGYSKKVEKKDAFKNVKRENDLMNDIMTKTNKASSMLKKAGKEFGKSLIQK